MSFRSLLVILLALVFGASAAIGVVMIRNTGPAEASAAPVETVTVVVAADDVARFTTLSSDMLTTREFPKNLAPASAASRIEDVTDRVTLTALVKDEPVLDSKVSARGTGHGMAPGIPRGMRAFTIQTPNVSTGVAGFILPGNKVDVLLTLNASGNNDTSGGGSTVTLLQGVEVLAVDQRVDVPVSNKADPNLRSVTLLVSPEQVAKLTLGQDRGTLHLSLRNTEDSSAAPPNRITLAQIGIAPEAQSAAVKEPEGSPPPPPPPPARIRTLRATQGGLVEVD